LNTELAARSEVRCELCGVTAPLTEQAVAPKKGTVVRNIRLDRSNADYIEGRVEGQEIVILTKFVKRQARD